MVKIVPMGWESAPLSEIAQIIRGITFPSAEKRHVPEVGLIPR